MSDKEKKPYLRARVTNWVVVILFFLMTSLIVGQSNAPVASKVFIGGLFVLLLCGLVLINWGLTKRMIWAIVLAYSFYSMITLMGIIGLKNTILKGSSRGNIDFLGGILATAIFFCLCINGFVSLEYERRKKPKKHKGKLPPPLPDSQN